jgi:glycerate dehydrogenase
MSSLATGMKIVVLDGYTSNPGDLSWDPLAARGPCTIYDRTAPALVADCAHHAEIVLVNKVVLDAATIAALPKLRYIGVLATGFNMVDAEAARARGIPVCNVPEYGTPNVAQAVFALLLELTNRTGYHVDTVRAGRWCKAVDFCYWDYPLIELHGRTLGIVGYGRIGSAVARIALAFGLKVLAHRSSSPVSDQGVTNADLDRIFRESDIVSLHCPFTEETNGLVNVDRLAQMKAGSFLINTARGGLIVEQDLADALNVDHLAGAGLDVLSVEPPTANNPLLTAKNCLITPHIAWATREARSRLLKIAADNIRAWQDGTPQNVVN